MTMAISKKSTATKATVSFRPDNMASAGLADDFNGTIEKARLIPWDYDGNVDHHVLAVACHITPDADTGLDPFIQYYSAGDLKHFVPADENGEAVDLEAWSGNKEDIEEVEGVTAAPVGSRQQLNNNSNFAHFVGALVDASFPIDDISNDVRFLEGLYGHFNRVPQKKRSGIQVQPTADGAQARERTILVVTEILESKANGKPTSKNTGTAAGKKAAGGAGTNGKAAASKKQADPEEDENEAGGGSLEERVEQVVADALAKNDGVLAKSKLTSHVIKAFDGKEKAAAVKLVGNTDFLEQATKFIFDADEGTITLIEE